MIVRGVFVPEQDCATLGKALLAAQRELRKNGVVDPVIARYTEQYLSVARTRRNVAGADGGGARSGASGMASSSGLIGAREVARRTGWSLREVQSRAASGAIGRKVAGRWTFTIKECEDLARSRRAGRGDRSIAAPVARPAARQPDGNIGGE